MTTTRIQITLSFDVSADTTSDDLDLLLEQVGYQITDPRDEDGEPARFETSRLESHWKAVKAS